MVHLLCALKQVHYTLKLSVFIAVLGEHAKQRGNNSNALLHVKHRPKNIVGLNA